MLFTCVLLGDLDKGVQAWLALGTDWGMVARQPGPEKEVCFQNLLLSCSFLLSFFCAIQTLSISRSYLYLWQLAGPCC